MVGTTVAVGSGIEAGRTCRFCVLTPEREGMSTQITVLALLTGLLTGALFRFLNVPIPAPPELPGIMGIVGIFVGYKLIDYADVGVDLLDALGL